MGYLEIVVLRVFDGFVFDGFRSAKWDNGEVIGMASKMKDLLNQKCVILGFFEALEFINIEI